MTAGGEKSWESPGWYDSPPAFALRRKTVWNPVPGPNGEEGESSLLVAIDDTDAVLPGVAHDGDAGYDLTVSRGVVIWPDSFVDVHCGIRLQLPVGTWGRITGRSSTLRKRGLLVNEAVIDNGYTGPIYTGVWNLSRQPVRVEPGERLAQIVLHRIVRVPVSEADPGLRLRSRDGRGDGGFGSTGA